MKIAYIGQELKYLFGLRCMDRSKTRSFAEYIQKFENLKEVSVMVLIIKSENC